MSVTDTWSDWTSTAASNSPVGTATPEIDDELRNIKAQVKGNATAISSIQAGSYVYAASAVGTDSYAITLSPALAAYTSGQVLRFKADVANTAGATLAVNALAATAIKKYVAGALVALETGDIIANQKCIVVYDSDASAFVLVNPATLNVHPVAAAGGTVNAITAAFAPALLALTDKQMVRVIAAGANTLTLTDIEGMTRALACVVTWTTHGLATNDSVQFSGITQTGWTALNGNIYTITKVDNNSFTIPVNTSGYAGDYVPATDPGKIAVSPTFNADSLGKYPIVKNSNEVLAAGDIAGAYYPMHLVYNSTLTRWVLTNPKDAPSVQTIVQIVNQMISATASGATPFVFDDTIPQNTEGDQYISQAFTPTSATNVLIIDVVMTYSISVSRPGGVALFKNTDAGAIAAIGQGTIAADNLATAILRHYMTAGTTSEITFKVRAGLAVGGTMYFNGATSGRYFGGVAASSITITEVAV